MTIEQQIAEIATRLRESLALQVVARYHELKSDDVSHHDLYRMLGVPPEECERIDLYQNVGRFVYKYAGALLEETTQLLLSNAGNGGTLLLENTVSENPVRFEIDCYTKIDNKAHEIKWRDATTDGDHIKKEHNKVRTIIAAEHIPVRVMYYMPVRTQARKIQTRILALFEEHGEAYVGDDAWRYVTEYSGVDLKQLLTKFDFPHPGWLELEAEFDEG